MGAYGKDTGMNKSSGMFIFKKLVSAMMITGACGGLFTGVMNCLFPDSPLLFHLVFFLLVVSTGIIIGSLIAKKSSKNYFTHKDSNGDMRLAKQKIYLFTPLAMMAGYYLFMNHGPSEKWSVAFLTGGLFILGLSGGIYDQFAAGIRKFVAYGMFPLGVGLLFLFLSRDTALHMIIWGLGFMYLISALITTSSIQLNTKLFGTKDINLRNSRKIRVFNYSMVSAFSIFCITAVFYRTVANGIGKGIASSARWFAGVFQKLAIWIAGDTSIEYAEPSEAPLRVMEDTSAAAPAEEIIMRKYVPPTAQPGAEAAAAKDNDWLSRLVDMILKWLRGGKTSENVLSFEELKTAMEMQKIPELPDMPDMINDGTVPEIGPRIIEETASAARTAIEDFLVLALLVLFVAIIIFLIWTVIRLLKKSINISIGSGDLDKVIEYDEEHEIIKTDTGVVIKRKYKYTRRGLSAQKDDSSRIRYLYGFILERLNRRKINIDDSDTPREIRRKILRYSNGEKLDEIGFRELTEKYIKVRYGHKTVKLESNILLMADQYEKAIISIAIDADTNGAH